MTPQEQLQLAEETLKAMKFKPKPYPSGPEWKKGNQIVFVGSANPLSNDLAALCEAWIPKQNHTLEIRLRPDRDAEVVVIKGRSIVYSNIAQPGPKNEALCRAVLSVKEHSNA